MTWRDRKSTVENQEVNGSKKLLLGKGKQLRPQVGLGVAQAKRIPNALPVEFHGISRQIQRERDIPRRTGFLDQRRHLDLLRGELEMLHAQPAQKGGDDFLQVGFHDLQVSLVLGSEARCLQLLQVRKGEIADVDQDVFLEIPLVVLPLLSSTLRAMMFSWLTTTRTVVAPVNRVARM